ncbi:acetylglutamate kinase [bacterium]|nr:acetylglutamate kinase [bacterium]
MTQPTREPETEALFKKAETLMEALPYIQRFRGATVVIKYGGHAMIQPELKQCVMQDVVLMENVGIKPVIVHGGGPEITALTERMGIKSEFVEGQRVTTAETLDVAEMVLAGKLAGEIVTHLLSLGGRAVGLSGKDGGLVLAHRLKGKGGRDIGFVGEPEQVNPEVLRVLEESGFIPVVSPIGVDRDGQTYNINADTVAAEIATALRAQKLILLTDVRGILRDPKDPDSLIRRITIPEVEPLISSGVITGGMIPKVRACVKAIELGVGSTHILDGRLPHALLTELFTDQGVGTMICA